jgi:hypothetical protein
MALLGQRMCDIVFLGMTEVLPQQDQQPQPGNASERPLQDVVTAECPQGYHARFRSDDVALTMLDGPPFLSPSPQV